jgi:hypothetical protein
MSRQRRSDGGLSALLPSILREPICMACIATKTVSTEDEVRRALKRVAAYFELDAEEVQRCRICGNLRATYCVT